MSSTTIERRWFLLSAAGLFTLGLALRLHQIGEMQFWLDEALTGYLAYSDDWLLRVHNTPPLYFLLVRVWADLFGFQEGSLRALSALSSALLVPLAMYTGRSIFSSGTGLAAGIIVVVSPISIYYGQEARPYALLVTELMFVYWMLWSTAHGGGRVAWILLLCGTTTALYTHNLSTIPLALGYTLAVAWVWRHREWARLRLYLIVGGASVCLYIPWFLWWLHTTEFHPEDMQWLVQFWNVYPTWRLPVDSIFAFYHAANFIGGNVVGKQFANEAVLSGLAPLSIFALLALIILPIHAAFSDPKLRSGVLACLILLVMPLLVLLAISFQRPLYLPGRYDLIAYPAFVLLAGLGLAWLKDRLDGKHAMAIPLLLGFVLLIPPATRTVQFYGAEGSTIAEQSAKHIHQHAGEQDLVLMEEGRGIRTLYYLQLIGYVWQNGRCEHPGMQRSFDCRFLPTSMETAPAAVTRHWRARLDGELAHDATDVVKTRSYHTIYILVKRLIDDSGKLTVSRSMSPVLAALEEHGYEIVRARPDVDILHLRPNSRQSK